MTLPPVRIHFPLAAVAVLLAAAPLAAQAPVPFRTPELELLLPAGFTTPRRVEPADADGPPAIYTSERVGGGGTAVIVVVPLSAEELAQFPTRAAALEVAAEGIGLSGGGTLVDRTPVEDSTSVGFVARVREEGEDDMPLLRASITRGGRTAILVVVFLGPVAADGPPDPAFVASLASLRLRAPGAATP